MEFQQMRYVIAVAEERSFTRAAERCHVVQSALSHQIKALERELGVTLFARNSRRVEPTAAGEAFLAGARAALDAAQRAATDAAAAAGRIVGTLTVGLIPTVTALDVPALLGAFHRRHPEVRITVRGGSSEKFVGAIEEGSLDVAVLGLPDGFALGGVSSRILARERHVALVGTGHRLAGRDHVRLADLAGEAFVDFPAGSPGRAQTDLAFAAAGLARDVAYEVVGVELVLGLVRSGLAVALLTPASVPEGSGVVGIAVVDGATRVEYLAWSGFNPSPAARAFVDLSASAQSSAGRHADDPRR